MRKPTILSFRSSPIAHRASSERGIALVLTLGILVLVTMLVIAFAVSMRVENTASKNFNDLIKARQMAQAAVDQAVAVIRMGTPAITNAPTLRTYITSPGAIFTNNTAPGGVWGTVPLYTLPVSASLADSIDLNAGNLITGTNTIYLTTPHTEIRAGWSNVVANGQLVGRFAYWVDDESTKVNLNVAGTRGNDLEGLTPIAIDLRNLEALLPADQINITNYVATFRPLDTIESVKIAAPPAPAPGLSDLQLSNNKFYITVNSASPDFTPWGTKRLNLSNVVANSATPVSTIAAELRTNDLGAWFGGRTFADKYPSVDQIAANIVDYIDTDSNPTDSSLTPATDITPPAYLGLEQTPYVNELVISNAITVAPGVSGTFDVTFITASIAELWYMYTNSAGWTPPAGTEVLILNRPSITIEQTNGLPVPPITFLASPPAQPAAAAMTPNSFATVQINDTNTVPGLTTNEVTITLNKGQVTVIYRQPLGRLDFAVIPLTNYTLHITPAVTSASLNWTALCNDPRVKPVNNDWNATGGGNVQGVGSLGQPNPGGVNGLNRQVVTTTTNVPATNLRADGDDSCHIISGSRDRGTMYPGELGFIHTGIPWRTFWLQPQLLTEGASIPDWAVLDLFSASDTTNVIGRININGYITPDNLTVPLVFVTVPYRTVPLFALLTNKVGVTTLYGEGNAATNMYLSSDLINVFNRYPGFSFSTNGFAFAGEVCEVSGLATNDFTGSSPLYEKAVAETPVRGIANLITTRSSVFTIWAIAQSIREVGPPDGVFDGQDQITGEAKVQAIVERYEDTSLAPTAPDYVKFRTKYFRYIYE